jgi:hypothetical protein
MRELPNEAILMRYLLGDLPDDEKAQIESQYFTDDELFELLLALEDELRERFLKGKLSTKDEKLFETKYGTTPPMRNRLALSKVMLQQFSERAAVAVHETSSWENFVADFLSLRPAFKFALAFSVAAAIAASWFAIETISEKRQLETARVALQQKEKTLQQQLADEQLRSRDLAENLEKAKLPIVSFVLSPGNVRSAGDVPNLLLPSSPAQLMLQLDLEGVKQTERYDAVLYDERNAVVKRWEGLQTVRGANGLQVRVALECKVLKAQRYRIVLAGKGKTQTIQYSFGVGGR